jgi:hypothetical protein
MNTNERKAVLFGWIADRKIELETSICGGLGLAAGDLQELR